MSSKIAAESLTANANRAYFDSVAERYDESRPHGDALARRLSKAFLNACPFEESTTRVMDFACGTGLISRHLAPHCASVIGIDISPGMIKRYNTICWEHGIPEEEMKGICVNLLEESLGENLEAFDVIVVGTAYHHIHDIGAITRILKGYLKVGGCLLVADLVYEESQGEKHRDETSSPSNIVAHRGGFKEQQIKEAFIDDAGLKGFKFEICCKAKQHGRDVEIFVAKGTKECNSHIT